MEMSEVSNTGVIKLKQCRIVWAQKVLNLSSRTSVKVCSITVVSVKDVYICER